MLNLKKGKKKGREGERERKEARKRSSTLPPPGAGLNPLCVDLHTLQGLLGYIIILGEGKSSYRVPEQDTQGHSITAEN